MEIQPGLQNFTVPYNLVSWCPNGHSAGLPTWSPGPALPTTFASSCASTELAWRKSQPHFLWDWCGRNQEPRKKLSADESMFNRRNKEEIWTNKKYDSKYDQITSASEHAVHPWSAIIWGGAVVKRKPAATRKPEPWDTDFYQLFCVFSMVRAHGWLAAFAVLEAQLPMGWKYRIRTLARYSQ